MAKVNKSNQKHSLQKEVSYLLYRLGNGLNDQIRLELRSHPINLSQWRILSSLKWRGQSTVGELSACTVLKQPVISRILSEMENDGLIKRNNCNNDQRVIKVELTRAGQTLYDKILPIVQIYRDRAVDGFNEKEIKQFLDYLNRIQKNLNIELIKNNS